jgi:hypothetical protein
MALLDFRIRWVANLFSELAPYHPVFIGIAAAAFGTALYRLYGAPALSVVERSSVQALRGQRRTLWLLTAASLALILFPVYAPNP